MSEPHKDLVFVVSGGRTGTRFLGDRLATVISDSFSVHDPDVLSVYIKRIAGRIRTFGLWNMTFGKALGISGVRSIGQRVITGRIEPNVAIGRLRKIRRRYHQSIPESLVIESNSQWLYLCDELAATWPHARLIMVVRDPRSWIRSWLNKGVRWRPWDPVRLLPPGRLTPKEVGDWEWSDRWKSFDVFGRLAWEWRFVYSRLTAHADKNANARIFRFEDIFDPEDDSALRELVAFAATHDRNSYRVDIPADFTSKAHNASSGPARDWQHWSNDQMRLVDEICGPLMDRFGYGQETQWIHQLQYGK